MQKLMKSKPVIIICGDPKSTFNEILIKTLKNKVYKKSSLPIIVVGSKKLIEKEAKRLKTKINFYDFQTKKRLNKKSIYILNIPIDLRKRNSLNQINKYVKNSFEVGLKLISSNISSSLINGPISKKNFLKGKFNGITEFLAHKTKSRNEVMLIFNKELSVSPITTHLPINKVTKSIKKKIIINKVITIDRFYKKILKFKPKIALTGLNPHCETFSGKKVEKSEILPAMKTLKRKKIDVSGLFSADTIFLANNRKKFDVIVGMYHDQVLSPMKTIFGFNAINITLGLPFVRISPDHGPNYKMFGLNRSKPDSLIQAFVFLKKYVY